MSFLLNCVNLNDSWLCLFLTLSALFLSNLLVCGAAAAAAKSLQSCPTLCNPIDGSPPGSPIPGILQARVLEWVAIAFSVFVGRGANLIKKYVKKVQKLHKQLWNEFMFYGKTRKKLNNLNKKNFLCPLASSFPTLCIVYLLYASLCIYQTYPTGRNTCSTINSNILSAPRQLLKR